MYDVASLLCVLQLAARAYREVEDYLGYQSCTTLTFSDALCFRLHLRKTGAFLSIKPVDDIKSLPTLKVTTKQAKLVEPLLLLLQLLLHSSKGLLLRRSKRRPTLLGTAASISTPFLLTSMAFEECVILGLGSSRSPRLLLELGIQQASSSSAVAAVVVRGDDAVEREK